MSGLTITGDYRAARVSDLPRLSWVFARAYCAAATPRKPSALLRRACGWLWAVGCWPMCLLEQSLQLATADALYVAPPVGEVAATIAVTRRRPGSSLPRRLVGLVFLLAALAALVVVAGWQLPAVLGVLATPRLLLGLRMYRIRPIKGSQWPPGAVMELAALAAWPAGTGVGAALFAQVVDDLRPTLAPGQAMALMPGTPTLMAHYAAAGFDLHPGTPWMFLSGR